MAESKNAARIEWIVIPAPDLRAASRLLYFNKAKDSD